MKDRKFYRVVEERRTENGSCILVTGPVLLQDHGIAVLLPDKRGSEKSDGDWRTAGFHDLATGTLAALEFLAARANSCCMRRTTIFAN